jgi:cation diffusion facilitator CzcD-associated flavoprotein CzcO
MEQTSVLVVGASVAGLASAASLRKRGIDHIVIEKEAQAATPWRNHYERLHLHTHKGVSNLPYRKFAAAIPRYASRVQVVGYLDEYQKELGIRPIFNTAAQSIKREGDHWITQTNRGVFRSDYVIIATGPFGKPKDVHIKGMESFPGKILHSYGYKTGREYTGQRVLVMGFGNSACEIAIDLYEQGAASSMAVRSAVNVIPRDLLGIPILRISLMLSRLPFRVADALTAPLIRLLYGDLEKLGLKKKSYGVYEQIRNEGRSPVLDIGTIKLIREGHIKIHAGIDHIEGRTVVFSDGRKEEFDVIVAAIGYDRNYAEILEVGKERHEDLRVSARRQTYFGREGLYFCGFWIAPTGQIREIALDAQKIAEDIGKKRGGIVVV